MKRAVTALAASAVLPLAALAHESGKGPNGGPVVDSAGHHVEMVAKGKDLVLYLTEEADKPFASTGAKNARAIIQDGGKTATVPLQPAEPNRLVGTLAQPLGKGARVVVSATLADGHAVQARFVNSFIQCASASTTVASRLKMCPPPGQVLGGVDVCCGLVGLAGGLGARVGGAQGADRTGVRQGRNTGDRRSLSRRRVVGGRAQNRLASGRAGGA